MVKKMKRKRIKSFIQTVPLLCVLISYTMVIFFLQSIEEVTRILLVTAVLIAAAIFDIYETEIPLPLCLAIPGVNILHTVFVYCNLFSWAVSLVVALLLLIIYIINRNLIGLGDILLVTFCVQALLPEDIFKFLFFTFAFPSVFSLIRGLRFKNIMETSVPLAPSIAAAFSFVSFIF